MSRVGHLSEVVASHGMHPLLTALGATPGDRGRWFCPICQSKGAAGHATADLVVMQRGVRCWKCGAKGGWYGFAKAAGVAQPIEFAEGVYFGGAAPGVVRPTLRPVQASPVKPPRRLASYFVLADEMAGRGWALANTYAYGDAAVVLRFEREGVRVHAHHEHDVVHQPVQPVDLPDDDPGLLVPVALRARQAL